MSLPLSFASLTAIAVALSGCVTPLPVPKLDAEKNSGIGISVALRPPIPLFSQEPQIVYFVKLDNESELRQPVVIRSSYSKDGRVYLLNVPSGDYAAIAAFFYRPVPAPMPGFPPPPHALGGRLGFVTYFPEEMVKQTRVRLERGQFAFAGNYVVDQSFCCKNADPIQRHYAVVLSWRTTSDWRDPERIYSIDMTYSGSIREAKRDAASAAFFFGRAKDDLAEGGWAALIK